MFIGSFADSCGMQLFRMRKFFAKKSVSSGSGSTTSRYTSSSYGGGSSSYGSYSSSYSDYSSYSDNSSYSDYSSNSDYGSSSYIYYETDSRTQVNPIVDPGEYDPGGGGGGGSGSSGNKIYFLKFSDIVYNSLGSDYASICAYSGDNRSGINTVGYVDDSAYWTYFKSDRNAEIIFHKTGSDFFMDRDDCFGAKGWLNRIFTYEHEQGLVTVREFAEKLGAYSTSVISPSQEPLAPTNLECNSLVVVNAVVYTNAGYLDCTIEFEAESLDYYVSTDTWVKVTI